MLFPFCPDVSNVAGPHLIGRRNIELSIQNIRNVGSLHRRFFISMRARLLADQSQLPHQAAYLETADLLAIFLHHRHDTAAAGSASTLCKQLVDPTAQPNPFNVWSSPSETMAVVARARHVKGFAQQFNRFTGTELINQRMRLIWPNDSGHP